MYKAPIFSLLLWVCCGIALGQDADSTTFADSQWTVSGVARKVRLLTHHFNSGNLFGANQNISYLEIKNKGKKPVFEIGFEPVVLKPTSVYGTASGALAAINGTFFDIKNGGSVDFIKAKGTVINENRLEKNGQRAAHQQAAIVINKGKLSIKKWDGSASWEQNLEGQDVMVTGPLLQINQVNEKLDSSSFNITRHPRTAIGIKPGGKIILLTVDGRNANSAGMSIFELSKIMRWLGCTSSINLDGGGSTALWVQHYPENGIINYPTDNKLWDHAGERKVANVILLKKKP
ncbi:MAG: phosphodiester glycosidase family protein [Bacteroidota bacterium]